MSNIDYYNPSVDFHNLNPEEYTKLLEKLANSDSNRLMVSDRGLEVVGRLRAAWERFSGNVGGDNLTKVELVNYELLKLLKYGASSSSFDSVEIQKLVTKLKDKMSAYEDRKEVVDALKSMELDGKLVDPALMTSRLSVAVNEYYNKHKEDLHTSFFKPKSMKNKELQMMNTARLALAKAKQDATGYTEVIGSVASLRTLSAISRIVIREIELPALLGQVESLVKAGKVGEATDIMIQARNLNLTENLGSELPIPAGIEEFYQTKISLQEALKNDISVVREQELHDLLKTIKNKDRQLYAGVLSIIDKELAACAFQNQSWDVAAERYQAILAASHPPDIHQDAHYHLMLIADQQTEFSQAYIQSQLLNQSKLSDIQKKKIADIYSRYADVSRDPVPVQLWKLACKLDSTNAKYQVGLGRCYSRAAEKIKKEINEKRPLSNSSNALITEAKQAIVAFAEAKKLASGDPEIRKHLARALYFAGQTEAALQEFRDAGSEALGSADHARISEMYEKRAEGHFENAEKMQFLRAAIDHFRVALQKNDRLESIPWESAVSFKKLGELEGKLGNLLAHQVQTKEEAARHYELSFDYLKKAFENGSPDLKKELLEALVNRGCETKHYGEVLQLIEKSQLIKNANSALQAQAQRILDSLSSLGTANQIMEAFKVAKILNPEISQERLGRVLADRPDLDYTKEQIADFSDETKEYLENEWLESVTRDANNGNWTAVHKKCEKILSLTNEESGHAEARYYLGQALMQQDPPNIGSASYAYQVAVNALPKVPKYSEALAKLYEKSGDINKNQGKFANALAAWEIATPHFESAKKKREHSEQRVGDEQDYYTFLQKKINLSEQLDMKQSLFKDIQTSLNLLNDVTQMTWTSKVRAARPNPLFELQDKFRKVCLQLAEESLANNNIQEGIDYYEKALQAFPSDPEVLHPLARLYESRNQWREAIAQYQKARPGQGALPVKHEFEFLYHLGLSYFKANGEAGDIRPAAGAPSDLDKAIEYLNSALLAASNNQEKLNCKALLARSLLARADGLQGDLKQAVRQFQECLEEPFDQLTPDELQNFKEDIVRVAEKRRKEIEETPLLAARQFVRDNIDSHSAAFVADYNKRSEARVAAGRPALAPLVAGWLGYNPEIRAAVTQALLGGGALVPAIPSIVSAALFHIEEDKDITFNAALSAATNAGATPVEAKKAAKAAVEAIYQIAKGIEADNAVRSVNGEDIVSDAMRESIAIPLAKGTIVSGGVLGAGAGAGALAAGIVATPLIAASGILIGLTAGIMGALYSRPAVPQQVDVGRAERAGKPAALAAAQAVAEDKTESEIADAAAAAARMSLNEQMVVGGAALPALPAETIDAACNQVRAVVKAPEIRMTLKATQKRNYQEINTLLKKAEDRFQEDDPHAFTYATAELEYASGLVANARAKLEGLPEDERDAKAEILLAESWNDISTTVEREGLKQAAASLDEASNKLESSNDSLQEQREHALALARNYFLIYEKVQDYKWSPVSRRDVLEKAIREAKKVGNPEAQLLLGKMYMIKGDHTRAAKYLAMVAPHNEEARQLLVKERQKANSLGTWFRDEINWHKDYYN